MPDDPCHFVAIEFDDRVGYLDLAHAFSLFPRGVGVAAGLRQSGAIDQPPVAPPGRSGAATMRRLIHCQCSCRTLEEWPCPLSSHRTGPSAASNGNGTRFLPKAAN